jgi:16S rRNA (guanine1207-N2)-methyltransferase
MRKKAKQRLIQRLEKAANTGQQPRLAEQLLIDKLAQIPFQRLLCTSLGRAQLAIAAGTLRPESTVVVQYLDLFEANATRAEQTLPPNVELNVSADFPETEFDVVMIPTSQTSDAELTRDLLQTAFERLTDQGQLWTSTNQPEDHWLFEVMSRLFDKVKKYPAELGMVYQGIKTEPLKKKKNYDCEFVFRDGERLFNVISRPGVFAHRRLDPGCRQLLNAVVIQPEQRVVDLGCGIGAVSLAVVNQQPTAQVLAIDCHARAIQCVQLNAAQNNLSNIQTLLSTLDDLPESHDQDVVITNPPYYGRGEIGLRFLQAADKLLSPQGQIIVVTKTPNWYSEQMAQWFDDIEIFESKKYWLVTGVKRSAE